MDFVNPNVPNDVKLQPGNKCFCMPTYFLNTLHLVTPKYQMMLGYQVEIMFVGLNQTKKRICGATGKASIKKNSGSVTRKSILRYLLFFAGKL